ncbi:MAG: SDR family NAD(P)-dependent oxidoreductase [Gammaproteobacteria bacterium]|nr:SDR family NAD(P)-dependent oxidoreductase [Gammaproteobacteria bacterium]MDH3371856.1 SDR family NAD(P)-dependent oxidoreductase [Gammaproteobacteria bacterium]MDH3407815.1 SDR family NAD(P)-dependent oxidoreductase [Gammaproteobacteria bacterium]MDH3551581.1 SDR family NAD(P)-dependent oxidoreductase [Gammaproteobacteria bacterium]
MAELDGKVAIVTGAGRGLGREEAIDLAANGARVVINEIDRPEAKQAAEQTVDDIKAAGGEATLVLGDCASTDDAQRLFETTIKTYGDMNIMVNNAGFVRDKTIFSMDDEEFDSVVRVHLRGHFVNMRNATAYWRGKAKSGEQVYGRLISTSSEAAIYGSAGQPNYAAAKAGIVAMTMGAAQLMIKYGITCNVIMPRAATDMTMQGPTAAMFQAPDSGFHQFDPANVAPLVTYLSSPRSSHIAGEVFIAWGNQVSVLKRPEPLDPHVNPDGESRWTLDGLDRSLSTYFDENHVPVRDGYSLPIG